MSALDLINRTIADLEGSLNVNPGESPFPPPTTTTSPPKQHQKKEKKAKKDAPPPTTAPTDLPPICQIEFKVGVITKVWIHPDADKLWCEEIDCGEASSRQICSGLRPYYSEEQMLGMRLLVVANLKAKNLKGFKSNGMVLCASLGDKVQFIQPPVDAPLGEVVQYAGLPPVVPASGAQVDKKKIFENAAKGLITNEAFEATWDGHVFMTSKGACKCVDIARGECH